MRKIEFRAKNLATNEWEYGSVLKDEACNEYFIHGNTGVGHLVRPETIGEFTGMYDKNDKKIYEGDIVLTQKCRDKIWSDKTQYKRLVGVVKYNVEHTNKFGNSPDKIQYWDAGWTVDIINKDDDKKYCYRNYSSFFKCEVIGNIHDNKSLLGGYEWN